MNSSTDYWKMKMSIPRNLPLLLIADGVLLPGSSMRVPVNNPKNMIMVKTHILKHNTLSSTVIGVIPEKPESDKDSSDLSVVHNIGTAAVVVQVTGTNWPRPAYTLLVTGLCRFRVDKLLQEEPYLVAKVTQLDKLPGDREEDVSRVNVAETFRLHVIQLLEMLDVSVPVASKLRKVMEKLPLTRLPDVLASIVKASYDEKLGVLDAVDIEERFEKVLPLLLRQLEGLRLLKTAQKLDVKDLPPGFKEKDAIVLKTPRFRGLDRRDRGNGDGDEIQDLEEKIRAAEMPEHADKACQKELKRLKKMPPAMPEYAMTRNYLELMADLPWSKQSVDTLNISKARVDLDVDHYGLDKLKKRVIEYLAVRQIKNSLKGPILCFIGPPGVGKTSVGRSIAQTMGRTFHRISVGGCYDQSDIRGHRRTYIGSMPGRIINGLRIAGVNNPVFLLDEIDKLGKGLHGDPASALLEVLDPEQNFTFTDHYLNVPFDLSQVLFIATANSAATIPRPLLDRMEIINVPGYTQEEKAQIATRHLVDKQLKEHGLTSEQLKFTDDSIKLIISKYTRESGVRALERKLGAVCRAVAVKVAEHQARQQDDAPPAESKEKGGITATQETTSDALTALPPEMPIVIDKHAIKDILGPALFESEMSERLSQPGVAIGLAWTSMGGEIMFVEAAKMEGDRELTLTGQLGDVMKESAQLALSWVRSHASECGLDIETEDLMKKTDVHIHFPAGAVGKDGPSAGITIACVIVSLFSDRCVRSDTAMTGEITLRGMVAPVGGIKEKVLAAHRAGIRRIIMPKRNEKDLEEVPKNVQSEMSFIFARRLEDVLEAAFKGGFPRLKRRVVPDDVVPSKL